MVVDSDEARSIILLPPIRPKTLNLTHSQPNLPPPSSFSLPPLSLSLSVLSPPKPSPTAAPAPPNGTSFSFSISPSGEPIATTHRRHPPSMATTKTPASVNATARFKLYQVTPSRFRCPVPASSVILECLYLHLHSDESSWFEDRLSSDI
ncbi:pectinesterase inhibitor 10-like [Capsicum annuum]|uniref:pectinesterase inhibitor 10-like n=1 Tax=Capsicum annuum TaxID=4072 RepID=UPI001FB10A7B|nr:pectinesterase inhibitor 10-like [Capsicum annuum]